MAKPKRRRQKEQAVVIAVKDGRLCLIKSNGGKRWILPKGSFRRGDAAEQVALQEAWEEAGLVGQLLRPAVGTYLDNNTEPGIVTTAFLMHVTDVANVWPEANRRRRWVDPQRALALLHSPQLRKAVRDALKQRTTRSPSKSRRPRRTRRQHESLRFVRLFE